MGNDTRADFPFRETMPARRAARGEVTSRDKEMVAKIAKHAERAASASPMRKKAVSQLLKAADKSKVTPNKSCPSAFSGRAH